MKQKETHRQRKQICGYQKGKRERDKLGVGINIYTVLYVINNKDLLYRQGTIHNIL